ncbi:diacylglycerol kinase [Candidatus Uhrbacteria bacterium]|nr:diacylglycerol kinase [Candidatus Uhrbacteria bacterium]
MSAIARFTRSFRFALRGFAIVWSGEQNFRIQVVVFLAVFAVASMVRVRAWEFVAIALAGGLVLVLECINSAVERLVDLVQPRLHGYVRDIKDIMAAAVLVSSLAAVIIGFVILIPYFRVE